MLIFVVFCLIYIYVSHLILSFPLCLLSLSGGERCVLVLWIEARRAVSRAV